MNDLLINPKTKLAIKAYLKEPIHALLLVGRKGIGLGTLATAIAKQIAKQNVVIVRPKLHKTQKTENINTEDIRELAKITQTKRNEALVIVVDDAEKMTAGAPEAFLKSLEEPVSQVYYILTSHSTNNLPTTILSRVQIIEVLPSNTESLTKDIKLKIKQRQIEFIANGLPAEVCRLRDDEIYFRTKAKLYEDAKKYLNASVYEKLIYIPNFKNREEALEFLFIVSKLAQMKSTNPKTLAVLSDVIDNLSHNGNIKAQLTYLATNW
ncbi:AAA family ATPase [Ruminococcaceae bacterium OttesenSCG-928-A11]|nr:AAA family ATPase [Ruminococcaceae bacterium OttesenSCG-928-A11]